MVNPMMNMTGLFKNPAYLSYSLFPWFILFGPGINVLPEL